MTEHTRDPFRPDDLDNTIDRVVRGMSSGEAPGALRSRVMAAIAGEREPAVWRWAPGAWIAGVSWSRAVLAGACAAVPLIAWLLIAGDGPDLGKVGQPETVARERVAGPATASARRSGEAAPAPTTDARHSELSRPVVRAGRRDTSAASIVDVALNEPMGPGGAGTLTPALIAPDPVVLLPLGDAPLEFGDLALPGLAIEGLTVGPLEPSGSPPQGDRRTWPAVTANN